MLAVQGPKSDEVLTAVGLPTGHDYMSFETAPFDGHDVVVCRTGYTGERGYELVARQRRGAGAVGRAARGRRGVRDRCRAASAPATRCAPRWATRCTARTSASTSPPTRPGSAGRSAGRSRRSGASEPLLAEKEAGVPVTLRGLVAQGRGIARPQMSVKADPGLPGRRGHLRDVLADAAQGRRAGADQPPDPGRRRGARRRPRPARGLRGDPPAVRRDRRPRVLSAPTVDERTTMTNTPEPPSVPRPVVRTRCRGGGSSSTPTVG